MTGMRRIGSKLSGVLLAAVLLAGAHDAAFADDAAGPAVAPAEAARPDPADTIYDETQPGADDPRVKEGFAAYQAGDFKKAYDIWLPLAEAGNAEAQFRVGRLYHLGEGVEKSLYAALEWYSPATLLGHIRAIYNAARIYDLDAFDKRDKKVARSLFKRAAHEGYRDAQIFYGLYLFSGIGGGENKIDGLAWLLRETLNPPYIEKFLEDAQSLVAEETWARAKLKSKKWRERHSSK